MKNSLPDITNILLPIKVGNLENNPEQEFADTLKRKKNIIVISSHLDDAVLSAGSLLTFLSDNNLSVSVITVFTQGSDLRSDFINTLVRKGGYSAADEYFAERRAEDIKALAELGISNVLHLDFIDAAWRKKDTNESLYQNTVIGVKRNEEDIKLLHLIEKKLRTIRVDDDTVVFAPVGHGKHVDHVLVRDACTEVFSKVVYYMDFPYSLRHQVDESTQQQHGISSLVWTVDNYEKKAQAIACYKTQLESLCQGKSLQLLYETYFVPQVL